MSSKTQISLSSLALDLKRVSLGLYRGSNLMSEKFLNEAFKRQAEIDLEEVDPYIKKLLQNFKTSLSLEKDNQKKAEDALMYSILFQNYCQKQS